MQLEDDGALLRQYSENQSDEAFAALVARHINLVFSVALRSAGDPHHAEEITQAVFIILAKKAAQLRHDKALSSWLFQTTRLTAINFLRSEGRRHRREQEAYMQSVLNESGGDEVWRQIAPLLDTAVATLNEKDRRAIVLRFYEGKGLREVGATLGGNEESAKKRVARALEKLQRFFSKRGVRSTTTMITGAISANSVHAAPAGLAASLTAAATAKGAVTSVSTLALVKGALHTMAWTKAKKAAVTGGLMLIVAALGMLAFDSIDSVRRAPDIQGAWEGTMFLEYNGVRAGETTRTHVVLNLVKTNGNYTATVEWIEMGRREAATSKVTYDYPYLRIERTPFETWQLRINTDATQMILDHWIHFISADPVLFVRTSSPDKVPATLTEEEFAPGDGSGPQGYWEGTFDFNAQDHLAGRIEPGTDAAPVELKISNRENDEFRAEISLPEFGLERLPATGHYQGGLAKFTDDIDSGLFQGAMNDDGTELIGSWTEAGRSVPAKFKRADYRAEHAMDDEKDYSFTSPDELQGHWSGSWDVTIATTKAAVPMALDIAKMPDGSYSAAVSYVGHFERYPVFPSDFRYNPPKVSLDWKWAGFAYQGALTNGELVGIWSQGGGGFPLIFQRTNPQ